jgi:L-lactate dehydrogenase complex protein LldF
MKSVALAKADQVRRTRPDYAAAQPPRPRPPLRQLTVQALNREGVDATRIRLAKLGRERADGTWRPWAANLRERGAAIRRETLRDLPGYLDQLTDSLRANGMYVYRVDTPTQACEVITGLALARGVQLVTKVKSMATEEIRLNAHLAALGIDVVETDLGEYMAQLLDERPAHIVGPVLHKSRQDAVKLFSDLAGEQLPDDPTQLAGIARENLRADFKAADMGICGVNFAAADTGTLVLVTNEGNADMVTSQPDLLVAVMPVEKVIARLADVGVLVPLLSDTANKEFLTAYQTFISGPRGEGEGDGPKEVHVVIYDNGRTELLGTANEEILACIRCGNCQFSCPVFRTLGGGQAYGATYGGPVGIVLSPNLADDGDVNSDMPFLCSLCGACAEACPVKIPLPDLILGLRARHTEPHPTKVEPAIWRAFGIGWGNSALYRASVAAVAAVGRVVPAKVFSKVPIAKLWADGRAVPPVHTAGTARWRLRGRKAPQ